MRAELEGSSYTVIVPIDEVLAFARQWPGHNFDLDAEYVFQFSSKNGDLVDVGKLVDGKYAVPEDTEDGPEHVALSEAAGEFGARELNLTDVLAIRFNETPAPQM